MHAELLNSLLELAHSTSQNLAFAHREDVHVTYGEETITETNLLELRRRHPTIVSLRTFAKKMEAKNGSDWEWHIIGRVHTLRMRVQAKRIQRDEILKISHIVKSSNKEQIDLLIDDAKKHNVMPIYCFYSSEVQRSKWKAVPSKSECTPFESGCLIASAHEVKSRNPRSLSDIEDKCVPWHYLVCSNIYSFKKSLYVDYFKDYVIWFASERFVDFVSGHRVERHDVSDLFPTVNELNDPEADLSGYQGIRSTEGARVRHDDDGASYRERGITRLIEIDVRNIGLYPGLRE